MPCSYASWQEGHGFESHLAHLRHRTVPHLPGLSVWTLHVLPMFTSNIKTWKMTPLLPWPVSGRMGGGSALGLSPRWPSCGWSVLLASLGRRTTGVGEMPGRYVIGGRSSSWVWAGGWGDSLHTCLSLCNVKTGFFFFCFHKYCPPGEAHCLINKHTEAFRVDLLQPCPLLWKQAAVSTYCNWGITVRICVTITTMKIYNSTHCKTL